MKKHEKELLKDVAYLYDLSDKQFNHVLAEFKKGRDNINQILMDLFMNHADENDVIDYGQLQQSGALKQFESDLDEELQRIGLLEVAATTAILGTAFKQSYYRTAYSVGNTFQINVDFNQINEGITNEFVQFDWSGVPFSQRIWRNKEALRDGLKTTMARSIRDGESVNKIARRFKQQFNSKAFEAQRLARTETARVIVAAREKIYEENGYDKLQYLATLEDNTCDECAGYDGKIYDINDSSRPSLPRHPNCRCDYTVYFEDHQLQSRKNNQTKEYVPYQNYEQWEQVNT